MAVLGAADRTEWLLRADGAERAAPEPVLIALDDDSWQASIERFSPSDGLVITLSAADVHRDVTFDARQAELEPWLLSHVPVKGPAYVAFSDGLSADVDPSRSILFLPAERRASFALTPQRQLRHAGIAIRSDRVREMFGDELPESIAAMIGEFGPTRLLPVRTSLRMRRLAASLFDKRLRGMLRAIFMEGVSLQLVALQVHAAGNRGVRNRLTEPVRRALADARNRLLSDVANPPTLAALATEVGMSGRALNAGFRRLYGETVFEVLRNERLELARIALESHAASIKVIAHRVGYAHVANFNAAFARRYGAPPLRYRNERDSRRQTIDD
jgi:AraC-like DNA-binding protein